MARQRFGQHFLVRGSVLERIARAACSGTEPLVIEIGPGRGALTAHLLPRTEKLIAIEIDRYLAEHVRLKFAGEPHLEVIQGDALAVDFGQWGPAVITGNLPYYAATPIVQKAIRLGPLLRRGVFLVQKEVAGRLGASPGTRDYGLLSVAAQLFVDVEILFDVKPAVFQPPPKVDSAVVRLQPNRRVVELGLADPEAFLTFVARCFHQKRKTLRNNLAGTYPRGLLDALPESSQRAEQINIEMFAALYQRLVP